MNEIAFGINGSTYITSPFSLFIGIAVYAAVLVINAIRYKKEKITQKAFLKNNLFIALAVLLPIFALYNVEVVFKLALICVFMVLLLVCGITLFTKYKAFILGSDDDGNEFPDYVMEGKNGNALIRIPSETMKTLARVSCVIYVIAIICMIYFVGSYVMKIFTLTA